MQATNNTNTAQSFPPDAGASLQDILKTLRRDRKRILVGFAVPMVLFTLLSFVPTPKYESTSSLLVHLGREYVYTPETAEGNVQPLAFDRAEALHAEAEILTSRDLVEKVINNVGLARLYPSIASTGEKPDLNHLQMAVIEMEKRLSAELKKDTNVIEVKFTHPDPDLSASTLNKLINAYLARRREIFSKSRSGFLEEQVGDYAHRLQANEKDIAQFRASHAIVDFDHQMEVLLDQRGSLETRLAESSQAVASDAEKLRSLTKNLASVPSSIRLYQEKSTGESVDVAQQKILDLRLKERDLSSKYLDDNALLQDVRADIARTTAFIKEQYALPADTVRNGRNAVRDAIETDIIRAKSDAASAVSGNAALEKQIRDVTVRLAELSNARTAFEALQREHKLLEEGYTNYVRKLQDARVLDERDQKDQTNVTVLQTALKPIEKKNYQPIILALGFLLSVCCAITVAFLSELLRQTFVSRGAFERRLGLPVLADIPAVPTAKG